MPSLFLLNGFVRPCMTLTTILPLCVMECNNVNQVISFFAGGNTNKYNEKLLFRFCCIHRFWGLLLAFCFLLFVHAITKKWQNHSPWLGWDCTHSWNKKGEFSGGGVRVEIQENTKAKSPSLHRVCSTNIPTMRWPRTHTDTQQRQRRLFSKSKIGTRGVTRSVLKFFAKFFNTHWVCMTAKPIRMRELSSFFKSWRKCC